MTFEETTLGGLWAEPILVAKHKSCEIHLAEIGDELNIQFIKSEEQGKGHASESIELLKEYCETKENKRVSSTPVSASWMHL